MAFLKTVFVDICENQSVNKNEKMPNGKSTKDEGKSVESG